MAKKNNPEQEGQPAEEQEVDTPTEDTEEPQEETPAQEQETEDREEQEPEGTDEGGEEDPQDQQEEQPEAPAQEDPATDNSADLRQQLLEARGQIAAYAAGVAPGMVADAVTLAMAEAAKNGEVTEAAVTKAMEAVLKRHPEWKASGAEKGKGGFKVGADRDSGGAYKKQNTSTPQNTKRWNRYK